MSWKSLVSAGLVCILASPALAVPNLTVSSGGLDANGNWIWNVTITPTGATSPVAGELGFRATGSGVVSASKGLGFTGANTNNPGTQIFTWETLTGTPALPEGLQTNATLDEVFAALGSIGDVAAATQYVQIITEGPLDTRLTTSLATLGKYGAGGTNGRIAEITSGTNSLNYSNFAGPAARTVVVGDVNLSGTAGGGAAVTIADFSTLVTNLNKPGVKNWTHGDFNGTAGGTEVTIADFSLLLTCLNKTTPACSGSANTPLNVNGVAGGAGSGAVVGAVPEPATITLISLAILGGLGLTRRKR